jgi:2-dehydropantoate 2-reductase
MNTNSYLQLHVREKPLKIAILGAGALGCAVGAALTEAGQEVWLLNRSATHVEAMRRDGLRVDDANGSRRVMVRATTQAAEAGAVDLVVVLVKSFHTDAAMRGALELLGPETLVLSLQNGLGHEDVLAEIVGHERVLAGKTYVGGVMRNPGHIESGVAGKTTYIGELDGRLTPRVMAIAETFNTAGLATTVSDNIVGAMWDKLLVNVATGALTGATGLTYGQLYDEPLLKMTALAAVAEAMAVARAAGVKLATTHPEQAWTLAGEGLSPAFKTSMLQSLEKGSITEIDFINGAVVRWGQRHGVPTPVNTTLVACIKGIERAMTDRQHSNILHETRVSPKAPTLVDALHGTRVSAKAPTLVDKGDNRMNATRAYLEHVAIWVKDIHWHIRFFEDVLGMTMREIDGTVEEPHQYWALGGLQFIHNPRHESSEGRLAHLGVMCEDLDAALAAAQRYGVSEMPQGRNWLRLPDGLAVELIQAKPAACVAQALAIDPRAET